MIDQGLDSYWRMIFGDLVVKNLARSGDRRELSVRQICLAQTIKLGIGQFALSSRQYKDYFL